MEHHDHAFLEFGELVEGFLEQFFSLVALDELVGFSVGVFKFAGDFLVVEIRSCVDGDKISAFIFLFDIEVAVGDDSVEPGGESAVSFEVANGIVDSDEGVGDDVGGFFGISCQSEGVDVGSFLVFANELVEGVLIPALDFLHEHCVTLKVLLHFCLSTIESVVLPYMT